MVRPERLELPAYWFEANAALRINALQPCSRLPRTLI